MLLLTIANTPALAVTLGDPAGIGPEIIADAWKRRHTDDVPAFFAIGPISALQGFSVPIHPIDQSCLHEAIALFENYLPILPTLDCPTQPGLPQSAGAQAALAALELGVEVTASGRATGLVTGPVSKANLYSIGFHWPGQTEFIAERTGVNAPDAVMMLAGLTMRTVPLTIHMPIAEVPGALTSQLIINKARITARALQTDFGISEPRLAVAGLNPHAGESGSIGQEELTIIAPALTQLKSEGINVEGPFAADGLFSPHSRDKYDAILCMYHDQALIPIKALDFDQGVNITLGLPIIRASPDHGTAFDIAGKGIARSNAMIAALRLAHFCSINRHHD